MARGADPPGPPAHRTAPRPLARPEPARWTPRATPGPSPAPPPSPPSGPPAGHRPAGSRTAGSWPAGSWPRELAAKLGRARPRHPRAPFILLLIGLLGGALVCLLVISTTLAEGSYQITGLQQQNASLAKQEQLLTQQVAEDSSPEQIAQEAEELGMRPNPNLQFINTKTGKVVAGHPSAADTQIDVPGYTP